MTSHKPAPRSRGGQSFDLAQDRSAHFPPATRSAPTHVGGYGLSAPTPTQMERLDFVQVLLERRHAYMAAAVLRLGTPRFTTVTATAAIHVQGSEVCFLFNPVFFDSLDNKQLAVVLLHEAMHLLFRHPERAMGLGCQAERFLFNLACDAVVNDLIAKCFDEFELPSNAVTGRKLVGQTVYDKSAEEVLEMLRGSAEQHTVSALGSLMLDDHDVWEPDDSAKGTAPVPAHGSFWPEEIQNILKRLGGKDPSYGLSALGRERPIDPLGRPIRNRLERFLVNFVSANPPEESLWTRPPGRFISVYPRVILPSYRERVEWRILIAVDASGSVPASFLTTAMQIGRQKIANAKVTLISFDTVAYEVPMNATSFQGGGGTRVQAVEDYLVNHMKTYPDYVFVLTDGFTPPPTPRHPARWVWILPAWGSAKAVPPGSRKEFFRS